MLILGNRKLFLCEDVLGERIVFVKNGEVSEHSRVEITHDISCFFSSPRNSSNAVSPETLTMFPYQRGSAKHVCEAIREISIPIIPIKSFRDMITL